MPIAPTIIPAAITHTAEPDPRLLQARQRVAAHYAAEALARWRSGVEVQDSAIADAALRAQVRWHRQMQDAYVAWLQAGGFDC